MQLRTFADKIEKKGLNVYGVVVRQHGQEIGAHHWRTDERINIHSLSKSFLSCAVGIAMEEGLIGLDEQVIACFEDKLDGAPDAYLEKLTVRHLLTMSPGHSKGILLGEGRDALEDEDWVHYFLNYKMDFEPGTRFAYDTGATFLLSAMLQRKTGMTALAYLKPRLFYPLGIRNPQWFTSPDGITLGGGGLHLNTREISRLARCCWTGASTRASNWCPKAILPWPRKSRSITRARRTGDAATASSSGCARPKTSIGATGRTGNTASSARIRTRLWPSPRTRKRTCRASSTACGTRSCRNWAER